MQIFNFQQPKSKILQVISFESKGFRKFFSFLFICKYKINDQKGKGNKKSQGSRGDNIDKDNNNNALLALMQRIKTKWKLLLPPSNKHQSPSKNHG
jgi:hypothetical protein